MKKTPGDPKKIVDADSPLIEAINAGDHQRFYELVKRYETKLYNFGLRMCRDVRDTEDLVQDTFLSVFRYLGTFRYETKFKNWLYRIATSNCVKRRRRSKFAPERELSLEEFMPDADPPPTERLPAWAEAPLAQVLNEELGLILREAIAALPDAYRAVLVLRDIEGFNTGETAQILDLSLSNVKVRLHRARLFLRDRLKGYFDHDR